MAFTFRQSVGDREVIASGSVVLTGDGNFQCSISDGKETLEVEFLFENDNLDTSERYVLEAITPDRGRLHLINFRRNISGFAAPFVLGTLGDRQLYLTVVIYSIGGERLFHYTFTAETA